MFKIKIDSRFFPFSKAASPVGHIRSSIEELRWAHNLRGVTQKSVDRNHPP